MIHRSRCKINNNNKTTATEFSKISASTLQRSTCVRTLNRLDGERRDVQYASSSSTMKESSFTTELDPALKGPFANRHRLPPLVSSFGFLCSCSKSGGGSRGGQAVKLAGRNPDMKRRCGTACRQTVIQFKKHDDSS